MEGFYVSFKFLSDYVGVCGFVNLKFVLEDKPSLRFAVIFKAFFRVAWNHSCGSYGNVQKNSLSKCQLDKGWYFTECILWLSVSGRHRVCKKNFKIDASLQLARISYIGAFVSLWLCRWPTCTDLPIYDKVTQTCLFNNSNEYDMSWLYIPATWRSQSEANSLYCLVVVVIRLTPPPPPRECL